jgi:hypothetical protein
MIYCNKWNEGRRASEARHGANIIRDAAVRKNHQMTPENVTYWAKRLADGIFRENSMGAMFDYNPTPTLRESAFDWPIYRAAR